MLKAGGSSWKTKTAGRVLVSLVNSPKKNELMSSAVLRTSENSTISEIRSQKSEYRNQTSRLNRDYRPRTSPASERTRLLTLTNTYLATNLIFSTNRIISALNTNVAPTNPTQGHFIFTSLHEFGTNVVMFGTGEFRGSDIYLSLTPTANFLSGQGTLYFTGLT